jgi:hypothetical protein
MIYFVYPYCSGDKFLKSTNYQYIAQYFPSPDRSGNPFVPVPRLREAQKIGTHSGKKLQKNNIKPKKIQPKITTSTTVIPKT